MQSSREGTETACASFPAFFDTAYHLNDRQVVDVNETGGAATGTAYYYVVLIGENEEDERVQTTQDVRYSNEYVKIDGE